MARTVVTLLYLAGLVGGFLHHIAHDACRLRRAKPVGEEHVPDAAQRARVGGHSVRLPRRVVRGFVACPGESGRRGRRLERQARGPCEVASMRPVVLTDVGSRVGGLDEVAAARNMDLAFEALKK